MRHPAPTPSGTSLPLPRVRAQSRRHTAGPVQLAREAIEKFNALVHELHPDAPHIDADAIASVARWLDAQPAAQRRQLLQSRLDRLADLDAMRSDTDWPLEEAQEQRIARILGYVDSDADLIPRQVPLHGQLDDALLLELAWPMLAEDVDDYRDFCRFREETGDALGRPVHQSDWLSARAEEGALWEQMHRVHEFHYANYTAPGSYFKVS